MPIPARHVVAESFTDATQRRLSTSEAASPRATTANATGIAAAQKAALSTLQAEDENRAKIAHDKNNQKYLSGVTTATKHVKVDSSENSQVE